MDPLRPPGGESSREPLREIRAFCIQFLPNALSTMMIVVAICLGIFNGQRSTCVSIFDGRGRPASRPLKSERSVFRHCQMNILAHVE